MILATRPVSNPLIGEFVPPGDKSISHRALIFASLASGESTIEGLLEAEDVKATAKACRQLGARIWAENGLTHVLGTGRTGLKQPDSVLDMGNSGTAMRLLAGVLAAQNFDSELSGDASLCSRPMGRIVEPLTQMGARILTAENGTAPLRISAQNKLKGIHYSLPVASAQIKSCVLLAGLYASGTTCVTEPGKSRDHTEKMLPHFGVKLEPPCCVTGGSLLCASHVQVPSDISSAAFFLVAAAMVPGSDICLKQVGLNETRNGIIRVLQAMGANIEVNDGRFFGEEAVADIRLRYRAGLHGVDIPTEWVPSLIDEFPAVMALAACVSGTTRIRGAAELRVKESDRLAVMAKGLETLGVELKEYDDGIDIVGGDVRGGQVDGAGDHRCAMSFCILGQVASGSVEIRGASHIDTSYPTFSEHLHAIGGHLEAISTFNENDPELDEAQQQSVDHSASEIPVITIDGPGGSGKGTISLKLAQRLGWHFLDSGALYRLVALAALERGIAAEDEAALGKMTRELKVVFSQQNGETRIVLDGKLVSGELRTEKVSSYASRVAAISSVREALVERQRAFCIAPGLVADGRDMGTVIFPAAKVKIYLTASAEERASRRYKQLKDKGENVNLSRLFHEIKKRDERDRSRLIAPLKPAVDAYIIDSTDLSIEQVLDEIILIIEEKQVVKV